MSSDFYLRWTWQSYHRAAEGLSNALLEYMAAGRPIVATDVGATREVLGANADVCCVPSENVPLLAERINQLLDDVDMASSLARRLRAEVCSRPPQVTVSDFYRSLLD